MNIQTRPYQKGDEKILNTILKKIYHQEFTDEYWWWKYFKNPLGNCFCHCAILDGRIVGFAGGIPYRLKWGNREILAGQVMDLAVEPEFIGKKVFSIIQKINMNDIISKTDLMYGFTNSYSSRAYTSYTDFPFHVPRMIKYLKTESIITKKTSSTIARKLSKGLDKISVGLTHAIGTRTDSANIIIKEISSFDSDTDAFMKKIMSDFRMMHIRDKKYLNWRYRDHPLYSYTIFTAKTKKKMLGFVVLGNRNGKENKGFILEFFALQERKDVQHLLLQKTTEYFQSRNTETITCWIFSHSPYYNAFRKHLYVKKKGDLLMTFVPPTDNALKKDFGNKTNWHISCGDHESF